jgi:hypothetical protein
MKKITYLSISNKIINFIGGIFISGCALLLIACLASAINFTRNPPVIETGEMPIWNGSVGDLTAITFSNCRTKPWLVGVRPTDDRHMHPYNFTYASYQPLPLPGGWEIEVAKKKGWMNDFTLTLHRPKDGKRATWIVRSLLWGLFESAYIYEGYLLNSRYFAFATSGSEFVFFDRQEGRFIPARLKTTRGLNSGGCAGAFGCGQKIMNFLLAPDGLIIVDNPLSKNLRIVELEKHSLVAPTSESDLIDVKRSNSLSDALYKLRIRKE